MAPENVPIPSPNSNASRSSSPAPVQITGSPTIQQIPPRAAATTFGSPRNGPGFLSPNLQPRLANSHSNSFESLPSNAAAPAPPSVASTDTPPLTDAQRAAIVRLHLLSAEDQRHAIAAESAISLSSSPGARSHFAHDDDAASLHIVGGEEDYPTPYNMPGGDIVAPIYKWAAQQAIIASGSGTSSATGAQTPSLRRSTSLLSIKELNRRVSRGEADSVRPGLAFTALGENASGVTLDEDVADATMGVRAILEPGGFRRDFVRRRMSRGEFANGGGQRFTRSFQDFLCLYGHFGGENLEEIEEGEEEDEEEDEEDEEDELEQDEENRIPDYNGPRTTTPNKIDSILRSSSLAASERTPLFRRPTHRTMRSSVGAPRSASRKRSSGVGQHGDATVTQAVFMLLKSFVGTGVLFLGKAFFNGGILFSTIVLCFIAMISLYSFLLLVETRLAVHGSFGDIGGILYGKYMRSMILFSIVMSQAQNLQAFFMAVSNCATFIAIPYLIIAQLAIFLPLAMIRNIQKLSGTALIADAFILFGLVYIFGNEISVLATEGLADVKLFNSRDFPLLIGTAVFSFEGIGLVIPITESMKDPHQFPKVLTGVMIGVMFLFGGAGALAYAAYGSAIQTVVFVNLPQEDRFVSAAQFLYSIAILLSTPLQLFPAVRIMENGIFSRSGKHSNKVKWEKNAFRTLVVIGCAFVSWAGAADLDKFVSLIGSVACVPLCFCYPALLHYKACAVTRRQKLADIALFVFGVLAALYTTSETIKLLTSGEVALPPQFGKCPPQT